MEKLLIIGTFLCVRFNLNLLECKEEPPNVPIRLINVLISTYWNVKTVNGTVIIDTNGVLISTYWNVKRSHIQSEKLMKSFNLNLLECKAVCCNDNGISADVLISTYWNVKTGETAGFLFVTTSFNLNLLECKEKFNSAVFFCSLVLISTYWNVKQRCRPQRCRSQLF